MQYLFLAGDIQRLPDALGSTLFKILIAPDTVSIEHLSIEAVQVSLSLRRLKQYVLLCLSSMTKISLELAPL